jgi:hypothetical protein
MPFEQKLIGVAALFGWTVMWWLAFRAVIGGRIGPIDWLRSQSSPSACRSWSRRCTHPADGNCWGDGSC